MGKLNDELLRDIRIQEGLVACISCGTCSAVCPAAEFYDYDPRKIVSLVQSGDEAEIEKLLKSDTIWYCGECMSCVTRCPRANAPGLVIMALRNMSQRHGYFTESEKGRQQFALKRTVGENILKYGYCLYTRDIAYEQHQEAGPVWKWVQEHADDVYARAGANLDGEGEGVLRKIPQESLDELKKIFDGTGGTEFLENIERASIKKAKELGMSDEDYVDMIFTARTKNHGKKQ